MVSVGRLRFRRHLLACLLVALLNELRLATEDSDKHHLCDGSNHSRDRNDNGRGLWRRTRVRAASAQELLVSGQDNLRAIYRHDTRDDLSPWAKLARSLKTLVPVINLNVSVVDSAARFSTSGPVDAQIDAYYDEMFPPGMSLDELQLMSVRATDRMSPTPMHTSWAYASRQSAQLGSQPVGDEQLCALQLGHLAKRLDQALKQSLDEASEPGQGGQSTAGAGTSQQLATPVENFEARQLYRTGDLELMRYLDTFGKVPSELLRGNTRWYGAYESCLKTRLKPVGARPGEHGEQYTIKFRYCMGSYKSQAWPKLLAGSRQSNQSSESGQQPHFIRIGLCLPEACDSNALEVKENWRSIERLVKFNLVKPFNSDHYKLDQLYCVPDERSPLRSIPPAGWLLLLVAAGWLLLVGGATLVNLNVDKFYLKTVELIRREERRRQQQHESPESRSSTRCSGATKTTTATGEEEAADDHEELSESDILNVKLNAVKLSIYIRDKSRRIVPGVDLIDCLSVYSNWLRYTGRVKVAIVRQHERQLELERRRLENESLAAKRLAEAAEQSNGANKTAGLALKLGLAQVAAATPTGRGQPQDRVAAGSGGGEERDSQAKSATAGDDEHKLARVDTSPLNALKVVALVWIIAGHCIFYLASAVSNGANMKYVMPTFGVYALIAGALYITELFFVITGCLTAYLIFRRTTRLVERPRDQEDEPLTIATGGERMELRQRPAGSASAAASSPTRQHRQAKPAERQQLVALMDGRMFGLASLPYFCMLVVGRYLRILPTYLLVYAFVKLIGVYVGGEGQLWDYAVSENSVRRACAQESWWPVLTLTSNFVHIYKHCIVGGWYLSADMQFAVISVPMVLLLAHSQRGRQITSASAPGKSNSGDAPSVQTSHDSAASSLLATGSSFVMVAPKAERKLALAYGFIFCLGLISVLLAVINTMLYSPIDMSYLIKFSPHSITIMSQNILMYTNSVFRARAFLAGLLLGHLLYLYQFKLVKLPKLVQLHGSKLAVGIFVLGFSLMFIPIIMYGKLVLSHDITALLTVLNAGAIDLFLSTLIFLLCIGKAPKAVLFCLKSPMWSLVASLSLSAFLVHSEVIIMLTSRLDPPPSVSYTLLLLVLSATLVCTYGLAFVLYLTFEMPISRLIMALTLSAGGIGSDGANARGHTRAT